MVTLNYSSKDIARDIGSSRHTVDNHLKAAMLKLGVSSRFEAARLFVEHEPDLALRRRLASQTSVLFENDETRPSLLPSSDSASNAEGVSEHEGVAGVAFTAASHEESESKLVPLPRYWGEKNRLSKPDRLLKILWMTALLGLAIGGVMASLRALSDLL